MHRYIAGSPGSDIVKKVDPALANDGHTVLRFVYVSSARLPSRSANSVQVTSSCNALAREGCEVTLYGSIGEGPASAVHDWYGLLPEVRLRRCSWPAIGRLGGVVYAFLVCISVLFHKRPDLVYGRHALSLMLLGALGYPVAFEAHMPPRGRMDRWARSKLFLSRRFTTLVVVSKVLAEYYREHFPFLNPDRIIVAPNGSDDPQALPCVRHAHWPDQRLRVGYVGSFQVRKGVDRVVALARHHPDVVFVLAGGDRQDLAQVVDFPLPGNVDVMGYLPPKDAAALMCAVDILLAPYQQSGGEGRVQLLDDTFWGSPLKVFEYMASGVCAMVSDLPIVRELVGADDVVVLCRSDNLEDWIGRIYELKADPVLRQRLGESARDIFEKRFSRQARARRVLDALCSCGVGRKPISGE